MEAVFGRPRQGRAGSSTRPAGLISFPAKNLLSFAVSPSLVADRRLESEGRLGGDDRQAVVAVEVDKVADGVERSVLGSNLGESKDC